MGCCDNSPDMLDFETAQEQMFDAIEPVSDVETLPIDHALDRILAEDVISSINVPGYDNCSMDGYALRAGDLEHVDALMQVGKAFAGSPFNGKVASGQCVRIMTGAAMPEGTDTVVMQEHTTEHEQIVTFSHRPQYGENVRRCAEDIQQNSVVLTKGTQVSPTDIGLLASIGTVEVDVYRRLTVGLFSTGDELRLPGEVLEQGCIYDSNRFVIRAMLQRLGMTIVDMGIVADQPQALQQAFNQAATRCDAVISSGGVSVGEADYTKDVLDKHGEVTFWKVAMKPGKPFAFGTVSSVDQCDDAYFFGLPGNPVSATVTFHQLAIPALQKMAGALQRQPMQIRLPTKKSLKKRPGRIDFQRGVLSCDERGYTEVANTGQQGSGILTSLSRADCYLVLDAKHGDYEVGDSVTVQPFDRWLA